jgi:DNA-binding NtrC family response regulator
MAGEELLIADSSDRDREGLRKLFDDQGYVCTATDDMSTAKELVQRKFFPVAVIDLDFRTTGGGLELARFIEEKSRPTRILLLTGRRSFEAAVEALRLGVVDVVSKRPDQIAHLQSTVRRAIDLARTGDKGGALLNEVKDVLAEALKIMLAMGRKVYGGVDTSGSGFAMKPAILIIDEDQEFLKQIADKLADKPWDVSIELNGGAGLDRASTFNFQIVAVRDHLSDLPGHMLLRSAQAQQTQVLGLLYSFAGEGKAERYEGGRPVRAFACTSPDDLVRCMQDLVTELSARREERRYMQAFRTEHGAFLKRFAELKVRIDQLTD